MEEHGRMQLQGMPMPKNRRERRKSKESLPPWPTRRSIDRSDEVAASRRGGGDGYMYASFLPPWKAGAKLASYSYS